MSDRSIIWPDSQFFSVASRFADLRALSSNPRADPTRKRLICWKRHGEGKSREWHDSQNAARNTGGWTQPLAPKGSPIGSTTFFGRRKGRQGRQARRKTMAPAATRQAAAMRRAPHRSFKTRDESAAAKMTPVSRKAATGAKAPRVSAQMTIP